MMRYTFLAAESDIDGVVHEMRLQDTSSSRIMIIGGGKIGFTLAQKPRRVTIKLKLLSQTKRGVRPFQDN